METRPVSPQSPRLLDRLRATIRVRHYSIRTEEAYVDWARRYILFHDKRHPEEMGPVELTAFLGPMSFPVEIDTSTNMTTGGTTPGS